MNATRLMFAYVLAAGIAGCAVAPKRTVVEGIPSCAEAFADLQSQASKLAFDPGHVRAVGDHPGLASNRLLASFDPIAMSAAQREDWFLRLQAAGKERRELLIQYVALQGGALPESAKRALQDCEQWKPTAPSSLAEWEALHGDTQIADDYSLTKRTFGVYPLAALAMSAGVRELQSEIIADFLKPVEALPVAGVLERYVPAYAQNTGDATPVIPSRLPADSLGIRLSAIMPHDLEALYHLHAPIVEVDEVSNADKLGTPYFDGLGVPRVNLQQPAAYRYATLMPFAGELRLQLNYVFWFDARPAEKRLDTLAGRLDGLVWRATLDTDGSVLAYDSIHPCGCYQQFFPGPKLALRAETLEWAEPPLVPQDAPRLAPGERPVLRVSSGHHFLQSVYPESRRNAVAAPVRAEDVRSTSYAVYAHAALYRVPGPDGPQSLYSRNGIVAGTERAERWYLWPSGVLSPGAMRDRGRHATAFLGRRHFDDPDLLDNLFAYAP